MKKTNRILLGIFSLMVLFSLLNISSVAATPPQIDVTDKDTYQTQFQAGELYQFRFRLRTQLAFRFNVNVDANLYCDAMQIGSKDFVLELGCGYGRVLSYIASKATRVIGIDNANSNLVLAKKMLNHFSNCFLLTMDAINLTFQSHMFDIVICIQNGMSAFQVDKSKLIAESIRVTKNNGYILFSSYSNRFWEDRLEWFQLQSKYGLIGEIDY